MFLSQTLSGLRRAGLIQYVGEVHDRPSGDIRISPQWVDVQSALGISLIELAALCEHDALVAKPILGLPMQLEHSPDIFVAMPFAEEFQPVYQDHIRNVANAVGLTVARGDDFFGSKMVILEVWSAICACKVVIADCTGRNPNVFYEIGLAHAIGKPLVLITQNASDVPFNLHHMRFHEYSCTPQGMQAFELRLLEALKEELQSADTAAQDSTMEKLQRSGRFVLQDVAVAVLGLKAACRVEVATKISEQREDGATSEDVYSLSVLPKPYPQTTTMSISSPLRPPRLVAITFCSKVQLRAPEGETWAEAEPRTFIREGDVWCGEGRSVVTLPVGDPPVSVEISFSVSIADSRDHEHYASSPLRRLDP